LLDVAWDVEPNALAVVLSDLGFKVIPLAFVLGALALGRLRSNEFVGNLVF